ncbi:chaperone modulator CbpM [Alloalcanivorax profundimaris]|uniref:chaperone modulator CbpM n=1 Tax=Alloalcanivorax profundimaris TaxID=2735259 RepID=UPI000C3EE56B|nr:chaperone modulator CbpM [Alloalcanivorax profundimaris]MAO60114.1 chaperone modulatory protein CbpM [Alcanivorax sp.]MBI55525.1 chaperone modulatory protein CbpM [Alcanivorax sp.]UWN52120.1 Chaperone modulatory protein CbpM [Alcanivorax sp. ALC70]HCE40907.1 chaperone modulatory protein CbpM [Alcanivorax sp.]|tara:strand:- start:46 stop:336 length:291 start_codon:yes stop_codon:yes gene_type:complete
MSRLTLTELSRRVALPVATVTEIVELGIIEPDSHDPHWLFDETVTVIVTRAARLHRDLAMDWSGVALALELSEENRRLRRENAALRRRLERFLDPR